MSMGMPIDKDIYDALWEELDLPEPVNNKVHLTEEQYDLLEDTVQNHINASSHPNADVRSMIQG